MNIKRALLFSIYLYAINFISYGIVVLLSIPLESIWGYVVQWLILVIALFFLAKWYFRKVIPTTSNGFHLGLLAIVIGLAIDGVFALLAYSFGQSLAEFAILYASWEFYVTIGLVVLLCTYTGFEFDTTYVETNNKNITS